MVSFLEAKNIVKGFARSFGKEQVYLDDALGRVLAENIFADRDYPPFNRSAMDGFAVRKEDIDKGINKFKVIDTIYAGGTTDKVQSPGECYKIMTGAAVPASSNIVIRIEDTELINGQVSFNTTQIKAYQNIACRGEDVKSGTMVLSSSLVITPSIIGVLATLGMHQVLIEKLPSVAIITTGDEVVDPGSNVGDVEIRNSNLPVLKAFFKKWNIIPSYCHHAPDNVGALRNALEKALAFDIVVVSGGVSAGDADHVPEVLNELGVEKLFHKVAIKPGKPVWCGHKKRKQMVFALPGNPFSCIVTFKLFIESYLNSCFGVATIDLMLLLKDERKQRVRLDEFFPVRISGSPAQLTSVSLNGSGDIRLAHEADALALHPASKSVLQAGEVILVVAL